MVVNTKLILPHTKTRYITIYSNSEEAKNNFNNDISSKNIFDKLNKNLTNNPIENYNILEEEISNSLEIHMNKKTVKFNRRKHKRDPWITFGILHSINRKNSLYKKLKKTNSESDVYEVRKQQFNQFKNTLQRTINHAKKLYFHTQFEKHEGNGTKTWRIVDTVNTTKSKVIYFSKKVIKSPPTMTYNDEPLEYVQSFKYLGLNFNSNCSFVESLDKLCSQARKAQTVLDLHVMRHPTMSVERALQLFDSLIKPIVMFDSEVWGVGNCGEIDKYFGGFLKKLLRVKQSTNTSMIYAEAGSFALSVSVKLSIVKYWLKVINSGDNQLIRIAYEACVEIRHVQNVITGP